MDLSLNEHQTMLKSAAANFMERECPKNVLLQLDKHETGAPLELWHKIAELGWLGMLIPAQYGGSGSSFSDAAVLYQELGKGPLPGPHLSSAVLGALTVLEAGSEEQRRAILPKVADGVQVLTLAVLEPERRWGPDAVQLIAARSGGSLTLNGVKVFVHDALAATHFICAVRTTPGSSGADGISLALVDRGLPGVSVRPLKGFMGWVGEVRFDGVQVPESSVLGALGGGWAPLDRAVERALPILAAYQVGGCEAVFQMSVEYSRTRIQFSQPIGRFQRVQDHIIEITNAMDAARWVTNEALWKLDGGRDASSSVHMAKVVASDGYYTACNHAHEVHAGIGVSWEYGLNLHTRMSRTLYSHLGDPRYHKRRMAEALL
ncbi:MAG: acyl-CoA dehydrogenase family protein [Chloroflexota bacterium]